MAQNGTYNEMPDDPAGRHSYNAANFTVLVDSARAEDWKRPSPVAEWTALDVVRHLIEWSRGFLQGAGINLEPLDIEADPLAAWNRHVADIQGILDDPAGRVLSNQHIGDKPVDEAIDQFYTGDIWLHSWDLAKALGREPDLGQERCRAALEGMKPMEHLLRDSGQFGQAVPVAEDASPQDKLAAFIGRDPASPSAFPLWLHWQTIPISNPSSSMERSSGRTNMRLAEKGDSRTGDRAIARGLEHENPHRRRCAGQCAAAALHGRPSARVD